MTKNILFKRLLKSIKKLAAGWSIFILITKIDKKTNAIALIFVFNNFTLSLKYILYIYHSISFKKNQTQVYALFKSRNKINAITSRYIVKLGIKI